MIWNLLVTVGGVGLIYVLLCFFVSGLNEWLATARGWRGYFLKAGIRRMLPDPPIYRRVMQHPLISGMYRDQAATGKPPSRLAPANFAGALINVIRRRAAVSGWSAGQRSPAEALRSAIEAIQLDHPLIAQSMFPILDKAGDDLAQIHAGIEGWFNSAMDRVTIWYEEHARRRLFTIALVTTIVANADAISITRAFWNSASQPPAMVYAGASPATGAVEEPGRAHRLPIGYSCLSVPNADLEAVTRGCGTAFWRSATSLDGWFRLLGWLLTALAVTIGAPYLFRIFTARSPR